MKIRSLLSVQEVEQISAQKDSHSAQPGKYDGKGKTDLPHQLERLICIIPHIPMHNLIYKYPRNEFAGGHKNRTPYHLFPQRGAPAGPYPLLGKEHQTYAAQQEH